MFERVYQKFGHRFLPMIFLCSRLFAIASGMLCIRYVQVSFKLESSVAQVFAWSAIGVTLVAAIVTFLMACAQTRELRQLQEALHSGLLVSRKLQAEAGRQAILFPTQNARWELLVDPPLTILPICLSLLLLTQASLFLIVQVCVAGFLGLSCIILATFFLSERSLQPVIRDLQQRGIPLEFEGMAVLTLKQRLRLGFGLIVLVTAVMIGGLAIQRTYGMVASGNPTEEMVQMFFLHMCIVTLVAVTVGFVFSHLMAESVTRRTGELVAAMGKVQVGNLSLRVSPTGNDEIDRLARQFNSMVEELETADRDRRRLTANLELLVEQKTSELKASLDQLQELDRLKTEFFSNVSHELRTPLQMILAPLAQVLKVDDALNHRERNLLQVAEINAQRLLKEINNLLEFSRIEAGHAKLRLSEFDATELVQWLTQAALPLAEGRGLSMTVTCAAGLPLLVADRDKLEIALTNLISNAIKFTPPGGEVRVSLEESADKRSPGMLFRVEDTGVGIKKSDCSKLFQRFQQLDGTSSRAFSGSGLGLALTREFVELHAGELSVDSEPGRGSRFCILIPRKAWSPERVALDPPSDLLVPDRFADLRSAIQESTSDEIQSANPEAEHTVLIVDDHREIIKLLTDILKPHYRVLTAQDGAAALTMLQTHRPDLVVSDVMMPNMDGYEFCRRLKGNPETASIPFILLTAMARTSMKIDGLNFGADDYLTKPFHEEELLARIRALLRLRKLNVALDARNRELSQAVTQLQQMQKQLVHSEKMTSLGQLVAGVAHEINNSINVVYAGVPSLISRIDVIERQVQSLIDEHSEPAEELQQSFSRVRRLTEAIEVGAQKTAQIIRDMKQFSHPGTSEVLSLAIDESLRRCLNLLQVEKLPLLRVDCRVPEGLLAQGRFGQVDQVFMNLISNAIDAMDGKGVLELLAERTRTGVRIRISDDGPGIPDHIQQRIFDPFFTTKPPGKGTGLGLSISYSIIEGCGGRLTCRSQPGTGTTFEVELDDIAEPPNPESIAPLLPLSSLPPVER